MKLNLPLTERLTKRSMLGQLILLNMLGLLVMVGGFLLLHETRQLLTNAYRQNLETQARLIATALSRTAQQENPFQFFEPSLLDRILRDGPPQQWQMREVQRIMAQSRSVSTARLRLYARDGKLVLDSAHLDRSARVIAKVLPPMQDDMPGMVTHALRRIQHALNPPAPLLSEINAANGGQLQEVTSALRGRAASLQRQSEEGGDILTVAVPVQGYRAIIGALMVSTQPGEIDAILAEERRLVLQLSVLALIVNFITSLILAATLIAPVRRLAAAMRGFDAGTPGLPDLDTIPDYGRRSDEIAELSNALRDMTGRLVARISTIDRFAADVAHELKNPLTSLHSAVQSLDRTDRAADPDGYRQLMGIVGQDVQRLNRLISDISNATRLDAELNRGETELFDLAELTAELAGPLTDTACAARHVSVTIRGDAACPVRAQKLRIAQILDNLLSNAVSFTPRQGRVLVTTRCDADAVSLIVADEGPGLAPDTQERIFDRFYTDRSQQPDTGATPHDPNGRAEGPVPAGSGHSGLGLSISRQIARAHGGDITAANRPDGVGAYFTLTLPLAVPPQSRRRKARKAAHDKAAQDNG